MREESENSSVKFFLIYLKMNTEDLKKLVKRN